MSRRKMLKVELIYDTNCPNVKKARLQLLRAFAESGLPPKWQEWDRGSPESPAHVRSYGSPTILVNGQDVASTLPSDGANRCRIYLDKNGKFRGVPSIETITSALLKTKGVRTITGIDIKRKSSWYSILAVLPGICIALLPRLTCPACWSAYTGLLSSLGLGFVNYTPYLLPLTAIFLILAVASLGYRAKNRRGYSPFILGIFAGVIVVVGKFVFNSDLVMYGGIAILMGASLWNSWPRRRSNSGSCPACVPTGPLSNLNKEIKISS